MMPAFWRIGLAGALLVLGGCGGTLPEEYHAKFLDVGVLEIRKGHDNSWTTRVIKSDILASANAVLSVSSQNGWVIAECHMNPSSGVFAAWNPKTNQTVCTPGYACAATKDMVVSIHRIHFIPPDVEQERRYDVLYVNGIQFREIPYLSWGLMAKKDSVEFNETLDKEKTGDLCLDGRVTYVGEWTSDLKKTYDVFYLTYTFRVMSMGAGIRRIHRVYFVRDGKIAADSFCGPGIRIRDNQVQEDVGDGQWRPCEEYIIRDL